jgi:hypothetical protein
MKMRTNAEREGDDFHGAFLVDRLRRTSHPC